MKKASSDSAIAVRRKELEALAPLSDDQIQLGDMPEQKDWTDARRGVFFRPIKKQLTLRLDADLIDWFKRHAVDGEGYQTRINGALRDYVTRQEQG